MQILEETATEPVCEVGGSGLFILSSLVSGSIALQTQTFEGKIHVCMECVVCPDQLKMIL